VVVDAVASRHFGCIAEEVEPGTTVLVFVEVTGLGVLSQRAVEQGRSLPESSSLSGGKLCAGRRELKQRMGLEGLEHFVRLTIGETGIRDAYTRPMSESQFVAYDQTSSVEASLTALTISCSRAILMNYRSDRPRFE
jgi:hypothetical protein